jgi:hypothetical protein
MGAEQRDDHVSPRQWIDFEHELRRRHLSSAEFAMTVGGPVVAPGSARPSRDLVRVRHQGSGTAREYDAATWKTDFIHDVHAGAF